MKPSITSLVGLAALLLGAALFTVPAIAIAGPSAGFALVCVPFHAGVECQPWVGACAAGKCFLDAETE